MIPFIPANLHFDAKWALLLLPLAVAVPFLARLGRRSGAATVSTTWMLHGGAVGWRVWVSRAARIIRPLALVSLTIALARPQLGTGRVQTSADAVAIELVVDRSPSMKYEMEMDGVGSNRLAVVKRVVRDFLLGNSGDLAGRHADLIGLVSFAGLAETSCPLVRDPAALAQLTDSLQPADERDRDTAGTAIGDGLALGAARLHRAEEEYRNRVTDKTPDDFRIKSKIIILLTDGANNRGEREPLEAAKLAADWGIKVYTIGVGAGTTVYQVLHSPVFGDQRIPMPSDVDERSLNQIAKMTGGKYFRAQDGEALRQVYGEIDRLEKTDVRTVEYTDYSERFTMFAAAGAALLMLEVFLFGTLLRRSP